jgi:hypothetical protein
MGRSSTALLFLLILGGATVAPSGQEIHTPQRTYSNAILGFRYKPPSEMRDKLSASEYRFRRERRLRIRQIPWMLCLPYHPAQTIKLRIGTR